MRKEHLYAIIGGTILAVVLLSSQCFGKDKHYLVKLKGNVLVAGHKAAKTNSDVASETPIVSKHIAKSQPAVKNTENTVVTVAPIVKPQIPIATPVERRHPVIQITNYEETLENLHAKVFGLYPGTYIDSVSFVNQLVSDSIRIEIANSNSSERIQYLKLCLISSMQDSITLSQLSVISTDEPSNGIVKSGHLIAHCKDASSSANMDSVVMDVFSGSTLVASASSDKNGTIQCNGIPDGNYYVVFSRRAYAPFSLMKVNVSDAGQSYIDVPLSTEEGYLFRAFGKNAWLFIVTGIMCILSLMVASAYYLAKYNAKRSLHTA